VQKVRYGLIARDPHDGESYWLLLHQRTNPEMRPTCTNRHRETFTRLPKATRGLPHSASYESRRQDIWRHATTLPRLQFIRRIC
jgi:hypothetical protein